MLLLLYDPEQLVVAATRAEKPLSAVPENMTVITADEIERMNAHSLSDVLWHVTGVHVDPRGGPGSTTCPLIQGAIPSHLLILLDGVALNILGSNFPETGSIFVQNIERVEVIKGPASSVWGSALGGVINIVTKPAGTPSGMVSASCGERGTADLRGEVSGWAGRTGFYVSATRLYAGELLPNNSNSAADVFAKLRWDVTPALTSTLTLETAESKRENGRLLSEGLDFGDEFDRLLANMQVRYALKEKTSLEFSLHHLNYDFVKELSVSDGFLIERSTTGETRQGVGITLSAGMGDHSVVAGIDFEHETVDADYLKDGSARRDRWGVFLNDTFRLGRAAVTPGIRYDATGSNGDFLSPSIGIAYRLSAKTVLRASVAKGFNILGFYDTFIDLDGYAPNPDMEVEEVWSAQFGVESWALDPLWFKATFFRHAVSNGLDTNVLDDGSLQPVNRGRQRIHGIEVEAKTAPVLGTSLFAGFTLLDAYDVRLEETVQNSPRHIWDFGAWYAGRGGFSTTVTGHYVWWNGRPENNGDYDDVIWEINLQKRIAQQGRRTLDLFATVHNVFDGSQYVFEPFRNTNRWVECGLRVRF